MHLDKNRFISTQECVNNFLGVLLQILYLTSKVMLSTFDQNHVRARFVHLCLRPYDCIRNLYFSDDTDAQSKPYVFKKYKNCWKLSYLGMRVQTEPGSTNEFQSMINTTYWLSRFYILGGTRRPTMTGRFYKTSLRLVFWIRISFGIFEKTACPI